MHRLRNTPNFLNIFGGRGRSPVLTVGFGQPMGIAILHISDVIQPMLGIYYV